MLSQVHSDWVWKILGLLPLGTSMDYESAESREQGAWEPNNIIGPFVEKWTSRTETPEFIIDDVWCGMVASLGFSGTVSAETIDFWKETVKHTYTGDEGRIKARMASINLLSRDGLLRRLQDIKCPVYWLQVSLSHHNLCILVTDHPFYIRAPKTPLTVRLCPPSRSSFSSRPRKLN